jgi:hypothetical protein
MTAEKLLGGLDSYTSAPEVAGSFHLESYQITPTFWTLVPAPPASVVISIYIQEP